MKLTGDGSTGASTVTHVKLTSLPFFTNNSTLPKIDAFDTSKKSKKKTKQNKKGSSQQLFALLAFITESSTKGFDWLDSSVELLNSFSIDVTAEKTWRFCEKLRYALLVCFFVFFSFPRRFFL